jgi:hypothetical protein
VKKVLIVLYLSQLLTACMQHDTSQEGLDASAEEAVGHILHVKTGYGWGWSNPDSTDPMPVAGFDLRLDSLWTFRGILRGGIGTIVTEGHPLFGKWVVFATRHRAHYDFIKHLGQYNLSIGNGRPVPNEMGWPVFTDGDSHSGFGEVGIAK